MSEYELQIDIRGFIKSKITGNSHTNTTALCELIHNSIAAEAKDIYILHNKYNNPIIVDNGSGMDKHNMDKLKKFYDSSERVEGSIGTYNIGLKEALLKFGGKWIILSKKTNTEDVVYCEFNCNNLKKFAYGGEFIDCIDSGFTNKKRQNIFINILDELGLINKNKESSLTKFSGTIVYQQENIYNTYEYEETIDYEENMSNYDLLYTSLKLKLSQYNCNFITGIYNIIDNNITIDDKILTKLNKIDWLNWKNNNNSIEFTIIVYKTTKNILFAIQYEHIIYKYDKNKCIFNILKNVEPISIINVKCNIVNNTIHTNQEIYYKDLNYKGNINGIMINRNGLDLYEFPNKYDNINIKDTNLRKYGRILVSFIGNDILDTIFNILPNKSLFLINNLNVKLKNILELIKSIVYEYLDLDLKNNISLKETFKYVLHNIQIETIRNKIQIIQNNFDNIINKYIINKQLKCIKIINKYTLCKIIHNYYYNCNIINIQYNFTIFKNNYKNYLNYIKNINIIVKHIKYKIYEKKLIIFNKLGLCITISKIFNIKNVLQIYFNIMKNNIIIKNTNNISNNISKNNTFINLNQTITIKIRYNQLLLLKYKILYDKLNNSIFI